MPEVFISVSLPKAVGNERGRRREEMLVVNGR